MLALCCWVGRYCLGQHHLPTTGRLADTQTYSNHTCIDTHNTLHTDTLHKHKQTTLTHTHYTLPTWCPHYSQDAHRQLEKAHTTLRRSAAIKLQSNIRRYLAIKKWPQMKHNLQHRTATPSPSTPVSRIPNGEVGKVLLLNIELLYFLIRHHQCHNPVTIL